MKPVHLILRSYRSEAARPIDVGLTPFQLKLMNPCYGDGMKPVQLILSSCRSEAPHPTNVALTPFHLEPINTHLPNP